MFEKNRIRATFWFALNINWKGGWFGDVMNDRLLNHVHIIDILIIFSPVSSSHWSRSGEMLVHNFFKKEGPKLKCFVPEQTGLSSWLLLLFPWKVYQNAQNVLRASTQWGGNRSGKGKAHRYFKARLETTKCWCFMTWVARSARTSFPGSSSKWNFIYIAQIGNLTAKTPIT